MIDSVWIAPRPLLLASTSRTRRALLESAGLAVETEVPGVDERAIEVAATELGPAALARRLAAEKALAVSRRHSGRLVLGADQVLDLDGTVLHKPEGWEGARETLARLQGRRHDLHSAAALAEDGQVLDAVSDSAVLTMRPLEPDAIGAYLAAAGETVLDSVGAYRIEGLGAHLFEEVAGDHATILGLPLRPLLARLRARGCLAF